MEVVEGAIGDVDGLHSKLERKTRVETSNSAAAQAFQTVGSTAFQHLHASHSAAYCSRLRGSLSGCSRDWRSSTPLRHTSATTSHRE